MPIGFDRISVARVFPSRAVVIAEPMDAPFRVAPVIAVGEIAQIMLVSADGIAPARAIPGIIVAAREFIERQTRLDGVRRARIGVEEIGIAARRMGAAHAQPGAFVGGPQLIQPRSRRIGMDAAGPAGEIGLERLDTIVAARIAPVRAFFRRQPWRGQRGAAQLSALRIGAPSIEPQIIFVSRLGVEFARARPGRALRRHQALDARIGFARVRARAIDPQIGFVGDGRVLRPRGAPGLAFKLLRARRGGASGQQRHGRSRGQRSPTSDQMRSPGRS